MHQGDGIKRTVILVIDLCAQLTCIDFLPELGLFGPDRCGGDV